VRLITRAGNDFSRRFPFIAMAVAKLPVRSCLIDGEAIVCDEKGAVFICRFGRPKKRPAEGIFLFAWNLFGWFLFAICLVSALLCYALWR